MRRTMIVAAAVAALALPGSAQAKYIHGRIVHQTGWQAAHHMSPLGFTGVAPGSNARQWRSYYYLPGQGIVGESCEMPTSACWHGN